MKLANRVIKTEESHQTLLTVIFVIYILFDIQLPDVLAKMVSSITGNIIVALLALSLFAYTNPILGILGLIVAYLMVHRSSHQNGSYVGKMSGLSEQAKMNTMMKYNNDVEYSPHVDTPKTLEQEMVDNMAPLVSEGEPVNDNVKPVLAKNSYAAPIDYEGVV